MSTTPNDALGVPACSIVTRSVEATRDLAAALAGLARAGDLVLLSGELGAGKTAFVQGFGRGLGVAEPITSPTFTLVHQHQGRLPMYHVDVYRLDRLAEVADLGLGELLEDGVTLIEWGDIARPVLPAEYLEVRIRFALDAAGDGDETAADDGAGEPADDDERHIELWVVGPRWTDRLAALRSAVRPWEDASC